MPNQQNQAPAFDRFGGAAPFQHHNQDDDDDVDMQDYNVHHNAQVKVSKQQPVMRKKEEKDPDVWDPPTPLQQKKAWGGKPAQKRPAKKEVPNYGA